MEKSTYTIRKNFLLPLGLIVLLSFILLISAIYLHLPLAKIIILGIFLLPVSIIFIESSRRKVNVTSEDIEINKLFRSKKLSYAELTDIDTIQVRKRVFISLSSENDFIIISNSYERFGQMVQQLVAAVPANIVSEKTRQIADNPPKKCSDIFSAWVTVAVLILIIFVQFRGTL